MVQVTKVNLPERTRARFEEENNQQRVQKPHDIRGAIPLVDYTNPAKFPPYIFREYPKMPLLDGNKPVVIDESGGVLVFYDATDEADFKDMNPELADEIERNAPDKTYSDRIAAQESQIEDLRARLRAAGLEDTVARKKAAATAEADGEPNAITQIVARDEGKAAGLRDTLPPARKSGNNPPKGNPLKKN
jgi:hypothetical protein